MVTLNQLISRLRSLATSHKQVNSFYFGDPHEFNFNGDINYGACFIELLPGSSNDETNLKTFNIKAYFLDKVGVSEKTEENETEVLSDMSSVADDFLAMLKYYQDEWEVSLSSPFSPHTEFLEDMVAGVSIEIGISVEFLSDRCQVPADDVEFETDFDMARTRILSYTGTGSEGASFDAGLGAKIVLAAYRAGNYKRVITTLPTDSDKIRVVGTDQGDRKGILSTTGFVGLQTGDALIAGEVLDFIIWE